MGPESFDFVLPKTQIAQYPSARREQAKLLYVNKDSAHPWIHSYAHELAKFVPENALVVVNDSQVVPARIYLQNINENGDVRKFEVLVCAPRTDFQAGDIFVAWIRDVRRLRAGSLLTCADQLVCRYLGELPGEHPDAVDPRARLLQIEKGDLMAVLNHYGQVPLPPYIQRPTDAQDRERYQTLYATQPGSIAAPTAGLHWNKELLAHFNTASITLHVGPGTFLPMDVEDVSQHKVGPERVSISEVAAAKISLARARKQPIVAIGTTVVRALESVAAQHQGNIPAFVGNVDLVITPDHQWRVIDFLITNFHLPRSSLLMLVCAFAGRERVLAAYREAVREGYCFYSYGDCMMIDRAVKKISNE